MVNADPPHNTNRFVYREGGVDILSAPMKYRNEFVFRFSLAPRVGYRDEEAFERRRQ